MEYIYETLLMSNDGNCVDENEKKNWQQLDHSIIFGLKYFKKNYIFWA